MLAGCIDNINTAVTNIDAGRKGFATRGKEHEGRILYETGIANALSSFLEIQSSADPHVLILAEYTFLIQELSFCHESDKDSLNSLTNAIKEFDDAFLALKAVEESGYKTAEKTYPHKKEYRVKGGFPKDSFHIACNSHETRIKNILRTPGLDLIEKTLLKQRLANLTTAKNGYIEKQKKALTKEQ